MPLTAEERNDLRKRVLQGYQMTPQEAREVIESLRQGAGVAILAGENKPKRASKGKTMTDDALEQDLAGLGL